jgi:hypothetical protein
MLFQRGRPVTVVITLGGSEIPCHMDAELKCCTNKAIVTTGQARYGSRSPRRVE